VASHLLFDVIIIFVNVQFITDPASLYASLIEALWTPRTRTLWIQDILAPVLKCWDSSALLLNGTVD